MSKTTHLHFTAGSHGAVAQSWQSWGEAQMGTLPSQLNGDLPWLYANKSSLCLQAWAVFLLQAVSHSVLPCLAAGFHRHLNCQLGHSTAARLWSLTRKTQGISSWRVQCHPELLVWLSLPPWSSSPEPKHFLTGSPDGSARYPSAVFLRSQYTTRSDPALGHQAEED